AAAVRGRAAVSVDNDLAAGEAGVAVRPADLKAARRVDVVLCFVRQQLGRDHVGDDALDISMELGLLGALVVPLGVLGRNHDRRRGYRLPACEPRRAWALGLGLGDGGGAERPTGGMGPGIFVPEEGRGRHRSGVFFTALPDMVAWSPAPSSL